MNGSRNIIWGVVAVVVVVLGGWWVLSQKNTSDDGSGPIVIGASLPLTGEAGSLGEQVKNGIDFAILKANEAGGVNGRIIEVVYEDDKCTADGSKTISKLVNIDNVVAILGPVCSAAAGPGLPIAQSGKTPTIFWGSAPGLTLAGDYVFRTYPSDSMQGKFAAEYVYNTMGKRNVAVLYSSNAWGEGLQKTFEARFKELGGSIVASEGADQASTDLRTQLSKIKSANPELIYIPLYPGNAGAAVKQAKTLGINAPMLGGDALEAKEFLAIPESDGVIISIAKFGELSDAFKTEITAALGVEGGFYTSLGYDAANILVQVLKEAGTDNEAIRDALTKLDYKNGISLPQIAFDENRDQKFGQFEVRIIRNGASQPYQQ